MQPADAYAACLYQQADGVFKTADITASVRLNTAHGDFSVREIGRSGVVPLAGQTLPLERRHHGASIPFLGGLGQEFRQICRGGVLQQRIELLHGAELLQVTPCHCVLVRIHHDCWLIVSHQPCQSLRLWGVEQQMVAVHVQSVGCHALHATGPIRICAWNDHHVDALKL